MAPVQLKWVQLELELEWVQLELELELACASPPKGRWFGSAAVRAVASKITAPLGWAAGPILDIQPRQSSGGGGLSREEQVVILADDLLKKLPSAWNKDHVKECMVKIGHRQPLNIFASQEVDRLQV